MRLGVQVGKDLDCRGGKQENTEPATAKCLELKKTLPAASIPFFVLSMRIDANRSRDHQRKSYRFGVVVRITLESVGQRRSSNKAVRPVIFAGRF